jgi:hypothetical protein
MPRTSPAAHPKSGVPNARPPKLATKARRRPTVAILSALSAQTSHTSDAPDERGDFQRAEHPNPPQAIPRRAWRLSTRRTPKPATQVVPLASVATFSAPDTQTRHTSDAPGQRGDFQCAGHPNSPHKWCPWRAWRIPAAPGHAPMTTWRPRRRRSLKFATKRNARRAWRLSVHQTLKLATQEVPTACAATFGAPDAQTRHTGGRRRARRILARHATHSTPTRRGDLDTGRTSSPEMAGREAERKASVATFGALGARTRHTGGAPGERGDFGCARRRNSPHRLGERDCGDFGLVFADVGACGRGRAATVGVAVRTWKEGERNGKLNQRRKARPSGRAFLSRVT